jgi:hypothetical protein
MFEPSSIPLWTAVAALAGVGQVLVLAVTACFVWKYLQATEGLRKEVQRQVTVANDQLEAQIGPAIVVRHGSGGRGLELVNVGKGPALHVRLSATDRGSAGKAGLDLLVDEIGFVEVGGSWPTIIRTQGVGVGVLNGRSLQCEYKSLSGRTYWTVADFDKSDNNRLIDTRVSSIVMDANRSLTKGQGID